MNPEYSKLEERRFSRDFAYEFTGFIDSKKNTAFFDKTWSSKEHRQRISRLLADYPLRFHEFESSTLSLDRLMAKIIDSTEAESNSETDFSRLCDAMRSKSHPGLVMVYRCSELSTSSVQLLSDLNAFLKRSKSRWKIVYFGEIEGVFPLHLELLAPDYIYTTLPIANQPSNRPISLTMIFLLTVLTILCLFASPYYWSKIQRYYSSFDANSSLDEGLGFEELYLPLGMPDGSPTWLEQDVTAWESRIAEFDLAMEGFITAEGPQRSNTISESQDTVISPRSIKTMSNELMLAAKNGEIEPIDSQISSGLNIDIANPSHETFLILAALHGQLNLVTWLLDQGANVRLADRDNGSALYYAAVNGHFHVAKKLLEYDASTRQVSRLNKTPLMAAVHNDYLELSSLLIAANSDVNQQDHSGWSALYYAIWNGNVEMTKLLLANGANAGLKDRDGYTPLDIAKSRKNTKILELL